MASDIGYNYIIDAYVYNDGRFITCPFEAVTADKIINPFEPVIGNINPFRSYNPRPTERN